MQKKLAIFGRETYINEEIWCRVDRNKHVSKVHKNLEPEFTSDRVAKGPFGKIADHRAKVTQQKDYHDHNEHNTDTKFTFLLSGHLWSIGERFSNSQGHAKIDNQQRQKW